MPFVFSAIFTIPFPHPYFPCLKQGHLEFFICNGDDLPGGSDSPVTQGCFNKYPLDRAEDDGDASPIDPNHPGRYYVDPPCRAAETDQSKPDGTDSGDVVTARYQLPRGLTCERCTIQMVYCEFCYLGIYDHSCIAGFWVLGLCFACVVGCYQLD